MTKASILSRAQWIRLGVVFASVGIIAGLIPLPTLTWQSNSSTGDSPVGQMFLVWWMRGNFPMSNSEEPGS